MLGTNVRPESRERKCSMRIQLQLKNINIRKNKYVLISPYIYERSKWRWHVTTRAFLYCSPKVISGSFAERREWGRFKFNIVSFCVTTATATVFNKRLKHFVKTYEAAVAQGHGRVTVSATGYKVDFRETNYVKIPPSTTRFPWDRSHGNSGIKSSLYVATQVPLSFNGSHIKISQETNILKLIICILISSKITTSIRTWKNRIIFISQTFQFYLYVF